MSGHLIGPKPRISLCSHDFSSLFSVYLLFNFATIDLMINSTDEIDLFKKFKDEEGNFKESLVDDSPSLLALYQASYLMVDG